MPTPKVDGVSRADAFRCLPERLVVETDPASPFYDARVKREVPEWLIQSIQEVGVILPVVVMRDGDRLVVNDGRQRVRACLAANLRLVGAGKAPHFVTYTIRKPGEDGDAGLVGVARAANTRMDDSPMERAQAAARLLDYAQAGGMSTAEARRYTAARCGVSVPCLDNWLALLDCATPVQEAVKVGEISQTEARKLARQPRDKQVAELQKMKAAPAVPVRRMRNQAEITKVIEALDKRERNLKREGRGALDALRWVMRESEGTDISDDLAEVLAEMKS